MRKIAENIAATLPNLVLNANKIAESVLVDLLLDAN